MDDLDVFNRRPDHIFISYQETLYIDSMIYVYTCKVVAY